MSKHLQIYPGIFKGNCWADTFMSGHTQKKKISNIDTQIGYSKWEIVMDRSHAFYTVAE